MFKSNWLKKEEGYELLDGAELRAASSSSSSSRSISPPRRHPSSHHHDPSTSSSNIRRLSFLCATLPEPLRRNRQKVTILLSTVLAIVASQILLRIAFMPPAYVLLDPESYVSTLEAAVQDRMPLESSDARAAISAKLQALRDPSSRSASGLSSESESIIPNHIFSSDKVDPSSDWAPMWKELGFQTRFYNDKEADAWVEREWKGTEVVKAWRDMPRMILRVDMLRYLLLLLEGGTWSDMDTVPLMHYTNWSRNAVRFGSHLSTSQSSSPAAVVGRSKNEAGQVEEGGERRIPTRAAIGIEDIPHWSSIGGVVEKLGLKPLTRHRNLQYVQWTIHIAPHHPILLDVVRRILETTDMYRTYKMELEKERQRVGWGEWMPASNLLHSKGGTQEGQRQRKAISYEDAPWKSIRRQWMWTKGCWRLSWHSTSVEEWTGPAVWTDSVVSYIYATTGVRPEDLAEITTPVQVGDVVILPRDGFHPPQSVLSYPLSVARVVHLFRGSWKSRR